MFVFQTIPHQVTNARLLDHAINTFFTVRNYNEATLGQNLS